MTVEGVTAAAVAAKANDNAVVHNTGNETIAGTKTFTSQPVLPQALTQGTAQNSTSGTSIDFTGIPSWAKRITVMFNGVSTSGTSNIQMQIGTLAGGFETTGYASTGWDSTIATSTTGFLVSGSVAAANVRSGAMVLTNVSGNTWVNAGVLCRTDVGTGAHASGTKTLAGVLDRVRITTVNGTDTFDAGSINILYE